MTAAQQTDVRSMYPHGDPDGRRVPRRLGSHTLLAAATVAAALPALLWVAARPSVGAALVAVGAVVATGARRAAARRSRDGPDAGTDNERRVVANASSGPDG